MASRVFLSCLFMVLINMALCAPQEQSMPLDCPEDQYYEKCLIAVCSRTCQHVTGNFPCPGIAPGCFMPACLCKDGKVMDDNGKCVSYEECNL